MSSIDDELISKIGGSVVANRSPGEALKSWRERLSIKQVDLAKVMEVSSSVLSDYESGRRPSPGVGFVRRYIEALIKLDGERGKFLERLVESPDSPAILDMSEFSRPVSAANIVELVEGQVLSGEPYLERSIYGYTVLDSIRTIYALSGFDFYKIFGATTERVLVFTKVGLGRSPLVAIRVSHFKPRMVILHGPKTVDKLAIDLAERERIVLTLSTLPREEDFSRLLKKL
ncbi:MAG: helix-turn-helix domain-containing protein [Nitrososphaerales archaeon]